MKLAIWSSQRISDLYSISLAQVWENQPAWISGSPAQPHQTRPSPNTERVTMIRIQDRGSILVLCVTPVPPRFLSSLSRNVNKQNCTRFGNLVLGGLSRSLSGFLPPPFFPRAVPWAVIVSHLRRARPSPSRDRLPSGCGPLRSNPIFVFFVAFVVKKIRIGNRRPAAPP